MKRLRIIPLASGFVLVLGGAALAQSAAPAPAKAAAGKMMTLQMPAIPDPVPVTLKPTTTAMLVADMVDRTCKPQPSCTGEMMPAIAALLAKARKAGVYVLYSVPSGVAATGVLPQVAPASGDPVFNGHGQDRFYNTDLDKMLKAKGITTVILTGWKVSGSVVYTSVGATLRGYTVVVPEDASLAPTDYDIAIGRYQILTQNAANPTNEPLKPNTSTLSRSDMITFQ